MYTTCVGQWNRNCLKKDGKSIRKKSLCKISCKKEKSKSSKKVPGKTNKKMFNNGKGKDSQDNRKYTLREQKL